MDEEHYRLEYKPPTIDAYLNWLQRKVFREENSEDYRLGWVNKDLEHSNILNVEIGKKKLYAKLAIVFSAEKPHCLQEIIVKEQHCTMRELEEALKELVVPEGLVPVRNILSNKF